MKKRGLDDDGAREKGEERKALPALGLEMDLAGKLEAMQLGSSDPDWWRHFEEFKDKHAWEPHRKATTFANELRACELEKLPPADSGQDADVRVLRPQTNFLDDAEYHPVTFSRACTRELSAIIFAVRSKPRFLLTGNPGTGKSRFLWELLWRALRWSRVVVLEMRKTGQVFIFVPPRPDQDDDKYRAFWVDLDFFHRSSCAALRDKNTLWLIDPEEVKPGSATPNPSQLPARTVLAASPNNLHYKGWHKNPLVQTRYMPPWTLAELLTVLPEVKQVKESLLPPGVRAQVEARSRSPAKRQAADKSAAAFRAFYEADDADAVANIDALTPGEISNRYRQFGGVIRVIFGDLKKLAKYLEAVEKAIATLPGEFILEFENAQEIADLEKSALIQQEDVTRVSSKLFAYESISPYEDKTVVPLSPVIQEKVAEVYLKRLQRTPFSGAGFADEFERVAGCHVTDEVPVTWLHGPVKDKSTARVGFPVHLSEEKLVLPRSPYGSPVAVWDRTWDDVSARLKKEYDDAVEPVDLKEGWTRASHVLKPNNKNQPVLDFFEVMWHKRGDTVTKVPVMYQATVSSKHPMSRTYLVKLLDLLGCTDDRPLLVIFVVPQTTPSNSAIGRFFGRQQDVFSEFKAQTSPNKDSDGEHQRVLNRVVQFKCAVELHLK